MIQNTQSKMKSEIKKYIFYWYLKVLPHKTSRFTFTGRSDGIGAQIHAAFSVILFAYNMHIRYAHTPLSNIDHRPFDFLDWDLKWEIFFGLQNYEDNFQCLDLESMSVCEPPNFNHFLFRDCLYMMNNCFDHMDKNISKFLEIKNELRECYYSSDKKNFLITSTSSRFINISIHIRRGDALMKENNYRLTNNNYILQNLIQISNLARFYGYEYNINIFSQGYPEEFKYLSILSNVRLFLDEDIFMTFDSLVSSDILITSKSSFSYVAALLSNNIVFYEPFWHPPLESWLCLNDLSSKAQIKKLSKLLLDKLR